MKPDPWADGDPVGERRAGGGDHLPPGVVDEIAAAGVDDDRGHREPTDHAAHDSETDLLEQQRSRAAAVRDP